MQAAIRLEKALGYKYGSGLMVNVVG